MIHTDVLVIGAGPSGCIAAAMIAKAGLKVMIVEKQKFPRFVIGESLLPRCMEVLEDAGLLEAVKEKKFQEKNGARFLRGDQMADYIFTEQHTKGWHWTWQVPRADFDKALSDEVQRKGVTIEFETTVTGIEFQDDERSITSFERKEGTTGKIEARFIIDGSGYGRVIPRLFNLDKPSDLDPRKAMFAHVRDPQRKNFSEPDRIIIILYAPGVWVWIIPFSSGVTSLGFVSSFELFETPQDPGEQFKTLIANHAYLRKRFENVSWVFEPRKLEAWSSTTEKFFGQGYVLTGNVTEFLDPIFSSGVMFATVSSHLASKLVIKKLQGHPVNWDVEYNRVIQQGVDTFRTYVMAWYDGTLEKIFFAKSQDPEIRKQICSVLAGYVWDQSNPFVRDHKTALTRLAKLIDIRERLG